MEDLPTVSVVIPAYNSARTLGKTLEACVTQDYPEGRLEVIVVDDGSQDATAELARSFAVRYLYQENAGPAAARNRGWRVAQGDIVCFTDADCVPTPDWVSRLVGGYDTEVVGGVGGSYEAIDTQSLLAACVHEEIVQRHLTMPLYVDYLGSFNASYRRQVLEEVGGFDESYPHPSGEDNDLAYRVTKAGYRLVFLQEAKVAHHHPEALLPYLRRQFWHGYWRVLLYGQHPDMARGDAYSGVLDYLQPPLALLSLLLAPLAVTAPARKVLLTLIMGQLTLQLPMAGRILRRTGQMRFGALVPLGALRAYARGLGMGLGLWRFTASRYLCWREGR